MTYATEFADYPAADMPAMPEGFEDTSWHNDACPSYSNNDFRIWIDFVDPAQREIEGGSRFIVTRQTCGIDDGADNFETDSWDEVLAHISTYTEMAKRGIHIMRDASEPRVGIMYHIMQGNQRLHLAYDETSAMDFIATYIEGLSK